MSRTSNQTRRSGFAEALAQYLNRLGASGERHSEAYTRSVFIGFLHDQFGVDYTEVDIEHGVKGAEVRGRIDALYKDIVFEFKADLERDREPAREQLKRYLSAGPERFRLGVITDGLRLEGYALMEGRLEGLETLDMARAAPDEAFRWLDAFLFTAQQAPPTPQEALIRFGANSPVCRAALAGLRRALGAARQGGEAAGRRGPSVLVKIDEWGRLLRKVYGSEVRSDDLFVRHTYLALLCRLLAYLALFRRRPKPKEMPNVVTGEAFLRLGIANLAEEDFFAWVVQEPVRRDGQALLVGLAEHLGVFQRGPVESDLLKELYQGLVDPADRHDLGEYYTPDWLAELILERVGYGPGKRLLDPACGSGTFLVCAVARLRAAGLSGAALVSEALSNLAGVDVHPLAVGIARTNLVLALAPDLAGAAEKVSTPIYMADSLWKTEHAPRLGRLPTATVRAGEASPALPAIVVPAGAGQPFVVPLDMRRGPSVLDEVITVALSYARNAAERPQDREVQCTGFSEWLQRNELGDWAVDWDRNLRLLVDAVAEGRDTIWAFILRNAYRPEYLAAEPFDLVVGNPPWLSYRYLRDPTYQKQVKNLTLGTHELLGRRDVNLFTHMDTSTLFYVHCSARFRKPDGTIAFVMPRSVLTGAKQHARFQRRGFMRILDLDGVKPLFKVPACVLITQGQPPSGSVPVEELQGELPGRNLSLSAALPHLTVTEGLYEPQQEAQFSPYHPRFREGATLVPRRCWFAVPSAAAERAVIDARTPYLVTDDRIAAKPPWDTVIMEGPVEAEFLYATLLGADLLPFGWRGLRLVVLPLKAVGEKQRMVSAEQAERGGFPCAGEWFRKAQEVWEEHRSPASPEQLTDRVDYRRLLTTQDTAARFRVLYGSAGTNVAACAIPWRAPTQASGLLVKGFAVDYRTYWYQAADGQETHYLCAVLNAPGVDMAIKPFQTRGAWGPRDIERRPFEVCPIPLFNGKEARHLRLAAISVACHQKVKELVPVLPNPIGRARSAVRTMLKEELAEIDGLVQEVLREQGWGGSGSRDDRGG